MSLVVTDSSGNISRPAIDRVRVRPPVRDTFAPSAVVDVASTVPFGQGVTVSGARSFDVGGRVVLFTYTLDGGVPVQTDQSSFTFFVSLAEPLSVGQHTVSLTVTDDSGNVSTPVTANFQVV